MKNYNFTHTTITSLQDIDLDVIHTEHYTHNDIDFLLKRNPENKILTVLCHGRAPKGSYPIFRGYDYSLTNSDSLSIADKLQSEINLEVTYYLHYIPNYISIIKYIYETGNYTKILFFGSSSAGFITLFLASYFQQSAFIANAFIYSNNNHYRRIQEYCNRYDKKYAIGMDIQAVFETYGFPKEVFLFSNKADSIHVKNSKPFLSNNANHRGQIKEEFFHRKPSNGSDPHSINMPSKNTEYWIQHFLDL